MSARQYCFLIFTFFAIPFCYAEPSSSADVTLTQQDINSISIINPQCVIQCKDATGEALKICLENLMGKQKQQQPAPAADPAFFPPSYPPSNSTPPSLPPYPRNST